MTFSPQWNERYAENTHLSIWPWSDLVSYVMRHARPKQPGLKVLEIGCGAGANVRFFEHLKADYYAVEGSSVAVERLRKAHPEWRDRFAACDFTREIPFSGPFDLVVDRSSLTHNATDDIVRCLKLIHPLMRTGARFIGIDWFSTEHSSYRLGSPTTDPYTRTDIASGQFEGLGRVHFSDETHLRGLFSDFVIDVLEFKTAKKLQPVSEEAWAAFNFVARKP